MTRERSGTTPSPRTRSQRSLTVPPRDSWSRLERLLRGGPAGVGMEGSSWRCPGKTSAEAEAREMGARGMARIPQRRSCCTDRCLCVNLRRRAESAEPQVWQKTLGIHPFSLSVLFVWSLNPCSYTLATNYSLC